MYTYAFTDLGYVGIYVAIGLSTAIFAFVRILVTVTGTVTASRSVHLQLLEKVMKLPMSFYDTQVRLSTFDVERPLLTATP